MTIINNVHGEPTFININDCSIPTAFVEELFYKLGYDSTTSNGIREGCEYQIEIPISYHEFLVAELPFQHQIQQNIFQLWKQSTNTSKD